MKELTIEETKNEDVSVKKEKVQSKEKENKNFNILPCL